IIGILKEAEAGAKSADLAGTTRSASRRSTGKAKYAGLERGRVGRGTSKLARNSNPGGEHSVESMASNSAIQNGQRVADHKHGFELRKARRPRRKYARQRRFGQNPQVICSRFAPIPSRDTLKNRIPGSTMNEAPIARRS